MEMERRESKLRTVLSWADEVEKEEAEAEEAAVAVAHHQVQEKPKPNPFGSARPREVVLQERGIHLQDIEPDLRSQPSISIFGNGAQKEVQLKDNIPAPSSSVTDRKEAISPQFRPIFHHPESAIFDPPLRYPPKNVVAACMFFKSHTLNKSPSEVKNWQERSHSQQQNNPIQVERDGIAILEDHREHGAAHAGYKRKGFHGNNGTPVENGMRWKKKEDDDRRKQRLTRPPLVESNQNYSVFRNQKLYNGIKRAEASHPLKMKQAWVRTTETKGMQ